MILQKKKIEGDLGLDSHFSFKYLYLNPFALKNIQSMCFLFCVFVGNSKKRRVFEQLVSTQVLNTRHTEGTA